MPVGEADKGVGAEKGKAYYGLQSYYSSIDWWHDPIEKELFKHAGTLNTFLIRPSIVYGITKKYNLMITTTIGMRMMNWGKPDKSIHHRTETSASDFDNANGGILGDSKIILRYLVKNTGMQNGFRIFTGGGVTIPSNNALTSDPFFLDKSKLKEHRHFSLSNGTYNYILEAQVYYKRNVNPTFYGGFFTFERPIQESEYGYLSPPALNISLTSIFKRFDQFDSSIGYGINFIKTGQGYWNNTAAPNSKSLTVSPSLSYLFGTKLGAIALNIQKPFFLDGAFASNEGKINQESSVWQFTVSIRSF